MLWFDFKYSQWLILKAWSCSIVKRWLYHEASNFIVKWMTMRWDLVGVSRPLECGLEGCILSPGLPPCLLSVFSLILFPLSDSSLSPASHSPSPPPSPVSISSSSYHAASSCHPPRLTSCSALLPAEKWQSPVTTRWNHESMPTLFPLWCLSRIFCPWWKLTHSTFTLALICFCYYYLMCDGLLKNVNLHLLF